MADLVLFGAGDIAAVARRYIESERAHRVVGFTVDDAYRKAEAFDGLPLVAWERLEERFPPSAVQLLGPLSYRRLNGFRKERHREGKARGYGFASFVHPRAFVSTDAIGENTFILEANILEPFVRVGDGVIMWSGNHVGHHSVIGDYCFFASHIVLASHAWIGERTFVSGQVAVSQHVRVGAACLLTAGAAVRRSIPDESLVRGPGQSPVVHVGLRRLARLI